MDKRLNKDWTGSVRDRLEKRELKPSDALWERIGEALPQAAAPHKVRWLPWGGVAGAAAAAAVAAVLLLRPSGAPEPGRVDVVPAAATVAMAERAEDYPELTPDLHSERNEGSVTEENRSFAAPRMTEEAPGTTGEEKAAVTEEVRPAMAEEQRTTEETPARTEEQNAAAGTKQMTAGTKQVVTGTKQAMTDASKTAAKDEATMMSMEEFLELEQASKRRHRSLTAAVFATGVPSKAGLSNIVVYDKLSDLVGYDKQEYDYSPGTALPDAIGGTVANSVGGNNGNSGYTSNPESQSGFEPVKYAEDPYNINGTRMNHSRPVGAGLALTIPLGGRLFAESGIYWSWLRSTSAMVSEQSLHSVGVPLKLGYDFGGPGRISFSLSAGGKAEKVFYAVRGGTRYKEPGIQFAAVGNAAVQFGITRNLGLFLAPELSYWFTQTQLPTYNTENPLNLSLKAGLNLTLGK